ncbi:MAG TPA: hypothetical protein VH481_10635 [Nitrososphaeraceae archaeon]
MSSVTCILVIIIIATAVLLFLNTAAIHKIAFAQVKKGNFNQADFVIKDFGIGDDGNPYIAVEGTAGGTKPEIENHGYAYVFTTDKGTYAVASDWMYSQWHAHQLTLDKNNCVTSMDMVGGADVKDVVKLTKTNATKIDKVMTADFAIDNSDGSICATRIFDYFP